MILDDLRELLLRGNVNTQEGICSALGQLGHEVNQSKVSRMLRKIGAVKGKNQFGEIVYRLPKEPAPPSPASSLTSMVIDVVSNDLVVLVSTSPGAAQVIGRLLDHCKEKAHILGTIAGDDTILVIPTTPEDVATTEAEIKAILFNSKK